MQDYVFVTTPFTVQCVFNVAQGWDNKGRDYMLCLCIL